ncbi:hypothetical protein DICVIV_13171 [Dictyocaulus viviparus]|uniref:Uncharacterized protein n=1 Tax=Dictyocaulus viviparus TaxID=29172 RepID=A0A0D8XEL4_DICVI|nr:hypothetical protein DICVIV_13171 [Dictyocaulus viviparus]
MHLLIFVLVGSVAATNIIEGSGEESSIKHAAISPDMEINGSGYGNDDEDGDALHGSGVSIVEVEGSGFSPSSVKQQPQVTTTATTTRIPPNHLHSESEQTQVFNPVVPIYQLPKDIITTVTATVTTPTRRVAIIPATTADPIATQSPFHPVLKPGIFAGVFLNMAYNIIYCQDYFGTICLL